MVEITEELKKEIWKEFIEEAKEEEKARTVQPEEMTVKMFAEAAGMSLYQARRFLDGLVEQGKVEVRQLTVKNSPLVYKPVA